MLSPQGRPACRGQARAPARRPKRPELFKAHDDAARAVRALRRLVVDERLLHPARVVGLPQPFQRFDVRTIRDGVERRDAGTLRDPVDDDRARAALCHPAAVFHAARADLVAQHVE